MRQIDKDDLEQHRQAAVQSIQAAVMTHNVLEHYAQDILMAINFLLATQRVDVNYYFEGVVILLLETKNKADSARAKALGMELET